jgi:hypothetical protein
MPAEARASTRTRGRPSSEKPPAWRGLYAVAADAVLDRSTQTAAVAGRRWVLLGRRR